MFSNLFFPQKIFFMLLASVLLAIPLQASAQLSVALTPSDHDGLVVFEVTNISDNYISLLKWDTPLEQELSQDAFKVWNSVNERSDQLPLPYIGRNVKRAVPGPEHFIDLGPGEFASASIDLRRYYDISASGIFNVVFDSGLHYFISNDSISDSRGSSFPIAEPLDQATLSNQVILRLETTLIQQRGRAPNYSGCSASEQSELITASEQAERIATDALNGLNSLTPIQQANSPRYLEWFGAFERDRFDRVLMNFSRIERALRTEVITYNCTCDEDDVYAYVFVNSPFEIFVCPVFWQAPMTGTDSKSGTVVHEMSHFSIIANTDDIPIGFNQSGTVTVSTNQPTDAINHANSYEYFAENNPYIALSSNESSGVLGDGGGDGGGDEDAAALVAAAVAVGAAAGAGGGEIFVTILLAFLVFYRNRRHRLVWRKPIISRILSR